MNSSIKVRSPPKTHQAILTEEGELWILPHATQRGKRVQPQDRRVKQELAHRDFSNLRRNNIHTNTTVLSRPYCHAYISL